MKNMRRVVITGMGAITPIGNNVDEFWKNIKKETVGIGMLTKFDTTEYPVKVAAEIKDFDPKDYMDFKTARRMDDFCRFAVAASKEAIEDSGLNLDSEDRTRIGTSIGCGIGSLQHVEKEYEKILAGKIKRVSVLFVPTIISNMAAGNVAINFGLEGKCIDVVTACATGSNSIGEAYRSIQCGELDVCVTGGTEAAISEVGVAGFASLSALTKEEDPLLACRPFDKDRSGFVMGEGAATVILEDLEHAKKRGAKIYAEIVGYGATCDAYHITSPREDGDGAARAMSLAIKEAEIKPSDVEYVNAHGTSTHHNDLFETMAIKKVFGEHAYKLKVNSTKSMVGHMLGAAGAIEFITCVKSINDRFVHRTVGFNEASEDMDLDYSKEATKDYDINYAISNSLGFGGHNASLLVKKYVE